MRKALLLAAALVALALPGGRERVLAPGGEHRRPVAPDGSLLVAENITIDGAFHGAYRDIPLRKGESIDRIQVSEQGEKYTRGGSTELGSIDTPHTFNYELHKNKVRIVWHFSAARRAAHVHGRVPLPGARGRLRRHRRRQPEGLGRELERAARRPAARR